jgi:uncharacterized membrane protein YidH (DUF202 family)
MVRVIGVLVALIGLILVGLSGDNVRVPSGSRLTIGLLLMLVGIIAAIFATQFEMSMGWIKP